MTSYLTAQSAAEALSVPYQTLMSWIRRKQIQSIKIGHSVFISEQEVSRHANNQDLVKSARKIFLSIDSSQEPQSGQAA